MINERLCHTNLNIERKQEPLGFHPAVTELRNTYKQLTLLKQKNDPSLIIKQQLMRQITALKIVPAVQKRVQELVATIEIEGKQWMHFVPTRKTGSFSGRVMTVSDDVRKYAEQERLTVDLLENKTRIRFTNSSTACFQETDIACFAVQLKYNDLEKGPIVTIRNFTIGPDNHEAILLQRDIETSQTLPVNAHGCFPLRGRQMSVGRLLTNCNYATVNIISYKNGSTDPDELEICYGHKQYRVLFGDILSSPTNYKSHRVFSCWEFGLTNLRNGTRISNKDVRSVNVIMNWLSWLKNTDRQTYYELYQTCRAEKNQVSSSILEWTLLQKTSARFGKEFLSFLFDIRSNTQEQITETRFKLTTVKNILLSAVNADDPDQLMNPFDERNLR